VRRAPHSGAGPTTARLHGNRAIGRTPHRLRYAAGAPLLWTLSGVGGGGRVFDTGLLPQAEIVVKEARAVEVGLMMTRLWTGNGGLRTGAASHSVAVGAPGAPPPTAARGGADDGKRTRGPDAEFEGATFLIRAMRDAGRGEEEEARSEIVGSGACALGRRLWLHPVA
jgi:hypothetical protein